jgi:hypothetical protein
LRVSVPKNIKLNVAQAFKSIGDTAKYLIKDKRVQAGIASIPVIGWANSEYKRRKEKSEHEKLISLYQEALRKHQAIIDTLENDKERESYKQQLWEKITGMKVEV